MHDYLALYDRGPGVYLLIAAIGALTLLWTGLRSSPSLEYNTGGGIKRDKFFGLSIGLALFCGRWPYLCFRHFFNPDESQQMAGAITLTHDPRFWLSVDGATAGPVDFYPLCLPAWLGGKIDYTTARLLVLLLVWGTLWFCYKTLRLRLSPRGACIGLVPLVLFFSWVCDSDLVEISTEHMPVFLLSAAFYFFLSPLFDPRSPAQNSMRWFLAGIAAGLAPWAKLQASVSALALLAAAAAISAFAPEHSPDRRHRLARFWPFLFGMALPSLAFAALMFATGQFQTFYLSYLAANLDYTYRGTAKFYLLKQFWDFACETGLFPMLLLSSLVWFAIALLSSRRSGQKISGFLWAMLANVFVSFWTILSPGRPFLHYVLFVIPGCGLLAAVSWSEITSHSSLRPPARGACIVFLISLLVPLLAVRALSPVPLNGRLAAEWDRPLSPLATAVLPYLDSHDTLAVWGWLPNLYIELNVAQGVRDAHTQREIENTPFRAYYRERYLADFLRNRPDAFVDAVGLDGFVFRNRDQFGFEIFPDLNRVIQTQYTKVADTVIGRAYIRNDRFDAQASSVEQVKRSK